MREGWFAKYTQNLGIDIGCGKEPVTDEVEKWDTIYGNSDATFMDGIADEVFDYVYSSDLIEHLEDPVTALRNWWRIIKRGGILILSVPHRDLYEKKKLLPSRYNSDHKHFFLPVWNEAPDTLGLLETLEKAVGRDYFLKELIVQDTGYKPGTVAADHPNGEYSIEMIVQKPVGYAW